MPRKTVDISVLTSRVNGMLAAPSIDTLDAKEALCLLIDGILLDNEQYIGFAYVDKGGERVPYSRVQADDYDTYRRRYYVKES